MIDATTYRSLEAVPAEPRDDAARQLEAFFLRRLLAEARPSGDGLTGGGMAGETFRGMLDEAIADKMAERGGIGLARVFGAQFEAPDAGGVAEPDLVRALQVSPRDSGPAPLAMPVVGRTSSGYGVRVHPVTGETKLHAGLDLAAVTGTPVEAAAAGTVTRAEEAGTYGNLVVLRHEGGLETRYAHLSEISVKVGQQVRAGDRIGAVGATGRVTGAHLHFEVRQDGHPHDPTTYLPPLNTASERPNQ